MKTTNIAGTADRKIVDELCYCGHLRSEHAGLPPIQGHGVCLAKGAKKKQPCICTKFTWKKFIYEGLLTLIALCSLSAAQVTVPQGTEIRVRLSQNVSSADAHIGDRVNLEVLDDVSVAGTVAIRRGAQAHGVVTVAHEKRRMGRAGAVAFRVESVEAVDGSRLAVDAERKQKGGNGALKMGVGVLLVGPFGAPAMLLLHGHDTAIASGTAITVFSVADATVGSAKVQTATAAPRYAATVPVPAASQEHVIEGYTISTGTNDAASAPGSQLSIADVARAAKAKREAK